MALTTPILDNVSKPIGTNPHTTTTAAPTLEADAHFSTKQYSRLRLYAKYSSLTALNVRVWAWDKTAAQWFVLGDSDAVDAFTPSNGRDEARDFFVGRGVYVHLQIATLTGTNASLWARGIDAGVERV